MGRHRVSMVGIERIGRVLVATLSRPPVNALNDELIAALDAVIDRAIDDDEVAVLHLRSDQRVFSAGADLALIQACFATPQCPDAMTEVVRTYVVAESLEEQWDLDGLERTLKEEWQLEVALKAEGVRVSVWDYPEQHKLKIYSEAKWWHHPPTIPSSGPR